MAIQVGDAILRFLGDTSNLDMAFTKVQNGAKTHLGAAAKEADSLGASIGNTVIRLKDVGIAFAAMKLEELLHEAVKAAFDFEKAWAEVTTILDTSTAIGAEQVRELKEQLLDLPAELGEPTELARGLYQALSAGVPAGQAVQFVGKAAEFAKASLTDMFTAVGLVTTILNAYGKSANETEHVTSALFAAITNGKTRGPELAESLGRVIPIAAAMKVELSQVLGALTALTLNGLSTREATVALRQALAALLSPTAEMQKMAAELGMNLAQMRQDIKDKGLAEVLGQMAEKTRGSAEATAALFGNVRALVGVMALTGPQLSRYKELVDKIAEAEKAGTAAHEAAQKMYETQGHQLEDLGTVIKKDFLKAWQDAKPIIDTVITGMRMLMIDSGALKLVLVAVGGAVGIAALTFRQLEVGINVIGAAASNLLALIVKAAGHIPLLRNYVNENTDAYRLFTEAAKTFTNSATDAAFAGQEIWKAMSGQKEHSKELEAATKAAAEAQNKKADADRAAAEASRQAQEAEARRMEQMRAQKTAAEQAAKAITDYAHAHGIVLVSELRQSLKTAAAFYDMLVRGHAPMSEQNEALANWLKTQAQLNSALSVTGNLYEELYKKIRGTRPGEVPTVQIPTEMAAVPDDQIQLSDAGQQLQQLQAIMDAFGIQGSAIWAKQAVDAQQAFDAMLTNGQATFSDLMLMEEKLLEAKLGEAIALGDQTEIDKAKAALDDMRGLMDRIGMSADKTRQHVDAWLDSLAKKLRATRGDLKGFQGTVDQVLAQSSMAFGYAVEQWIQGQKSLGEALREGLAAELATIAGKAAAWALYFLAWGIADTFWNPSRAGADFAAAAQFAAVAAFAGAAAYAIGPHGQKDGGYGSEQAPQTQAAAGITQGPTQGQNIPHFAAGGLVTAPTLALVGDAMSSSSSAAREAILPLDDPRSMAQVAAAIVAAGGGVTNHFHIDGMISDDKLDKVIRQINRRVKNNDVQLTASNALRVTRRG